MALVTNWVTKLSRLKNSKVARFSYKEEAYANDDIEGVANYDYSRDMNVPLATHTDFDPSMLSIGARAQFSSIPKNGLNHFFGRVSYNLNKVIDFLDDFLTDFISLDDRFTSFTEIVEFTSSATLSNYADGTTKRLLNTSGSNITITLPAGETYLGSNTILLTPSVMLTIAKRGTVWINSSGNAITATNALACSGNSATATKLATARKINGIDFNGTADIYDTYSTTEHRIGTWIDGKPIYRKVINFGTLPNNTNKNVAHGISNLDKTIRLYGIAGAANVALPLPHLDVGELQYSVQLRQYPKSSIEIITGYDRTDYTAIVFIEYTKTTD